MAIAPNGSVSETLTFCRLAMSLCVLATEISRDCRDWRGEVSGEELEEPLAGRRYIAMTSKWKSESSPFDMSCYDIATIAGHGDIEGTKGC